MRAPNTDPPAAGPGARPVQVLHVAGWGRSGSTLLDRMLGQLPEVCSVGELREIWRRGCVENRLCGCGRPFHDCPFWRDVGDEAFGGWDRAPVGDLLALRRSVDRGWRLPPTAAGERAPGPARPGRGRGVARYRAALARLYGAIGAVSGKEVVVDSSKLPSHSALVAGIPSLDLRLVHLVRDSRGVVYSWGRHVRRTDAPGDEDRMIRYDPLTASGRYVFYNALTHRLAARGIPYILLRYEELVRHPAAAVRAVLALLGRRPAERDLAFIEPGAVTLSPTHSVDGNPMRMAVGRVELRPDEEWRRSMTRWERATVSAVTAPLLVRYGYRVRSR